MSICALFNRLLLRVNLDKWYQDQCKIHHRIKPFSKLNKNPHFSMMIGALKNVCLYNFIQSPFATRAACTFQTWACCSSLVPLLEAADVFFLWHSSHSPAAHKEPLKLLEIRPWGWRAGGWWSRPRSSHREKGRPLGPAWTHRTRARPQGSELVLWWLWLCWPCFHCVFWSFKDAPV